MMTTTTLIPKNNGPDRTEAGYMQTDIVLHRGNSVIQHGHYNQPGLCHETCAFRYSGYYTGLLMMLSARQGYSKIFVKVPESSVELFSHHGYVTEATVPFFFKGHESAAFMAKYHDPDRSVVRDSKVIHDILSAAIKSRRQSITVFITSRSITSCRLVTTDAEEISALYRAVFESLPVPDLDSGIYPGNHARAQSGIFSSGRPISIWQQLHPARLTRITGVLR